jgi:hypothetical protein
LEYTSYAVISAFQLPLQIDKVSRQEGLYKQFIHTPFWPSPPTTLILIVDGLKDVSGKKDDYDCKRLDPVWVYATCVARRLTSWRSGHRGT